MNAVQVVQRDAVGAEPPEALLDLSAEHLRPALAWVVAAFRRNGDAFGWGESAAPIVASLSPPL